jgi:hypothetical protein
MSTVVSSGALQSSGPQVAPARPKRRSARLTISIPIVVRGTDDSGAPMEEQARTLIVSLHGAMLAVSRQLRLDSEVVLENPALKRKAEAVVLWCKQKVTQPSCYEAAVELKQPQDLWGVCFPKDVESSAVTATASSAGVPAAETPLGALPRPTSATPCQAEQPAPSAQEVSAPVETKSVSCPAAPAQSVGERVPVPRPAEAAWEEEKARFQTKLKELSASCVGDVQFLAQAHLRHFSETLAQRVVATRETSVKELEQTLTEIGRTTLQELRKEMEQELESFLKRASTQADQLADSVLKTMESRIGSLQFRIVPVQTAKD